MDPQFQRTRIGGQIERLRVRMNGAPYAMHRHESLAVGLTVSGVQRFWFRGEQRISLPGQILVIHPDERHDGGNGNGRPLDYVMLYFNPCHLDAAAGPDGAGPLPFLSDPVRASARLRSIVRDAFHDFPLRLDCLTEASILERTVRALRQEGGFAKSLNAVVDWQAVARAREALEEEYDRLVTAARLERLTGLTRYALARQFRIAYGTSPHRFLIGRRLMAARRMIAQGVPLAETATACGFADQSHLTRCFGRNLGISPGRFRTKCLTGEVTIGGCPEG